MPIQRLFSRLWTILGGFGAPLGAGTHELARGLQLVIPLDLSLPKNLQSTFAEVVAPAADADIASVTIPADGWYQIQLRATITTAVAAIREIEFQILDPGGAFIWHRRMASSGVINLQPDDLPILFLFTNTIVRVRNGNIAFAAGENLYGVVNIQRFFQEQPQGSL